MEPKTLRDTLADVKAEALLDALAARLGAVEPKTLSDTCSECQAGSGEARGTHRHSGRCEGRGTS